MLTACSSAQCQPRTAWLPLPSPYERQSMARTHSVNSTLHLGSPSIGTWLIFPRYTQGPRFYTPRPPMHLGGDPRERTSCLSPTYAPGTWSDHYHSNHGHRTGVPQNLSILGHFRGHNLPHHHSHRRSWRHGLHRRHHGSGFFVGNGPQSVPRFGLARRRSISDEAYV